jgi:glutaredoxin
VICAREDSVAAPQLGGATLLVLAAAVLLIGGVAYGLGRAQSATKFIAMHFRSIATQAPAAIPREQEAPSATPDPGLEPKVQEFQEAFANVWRAGMTNPATRTEAEPAGETATAAVVQTAAPPAASTTMTATATETADAATAEAATTTALVIAEPPPTIITTTPTTTAGAATPTPSGMASTTEPPTGTATPTVAPEAAPAMMTATASLDASLPSVRVVVYTAAWCGPCARAKAWMVRHGVAFEERDINASTDYVQHLLLLSPRMVIPTFDIEGDVMIGFEPRGLLAMIQRAARRQDQVRAP